MSEAIYEFPLNERMRNYLRVEHLMEQTKEASQAHLGQFHLTFFEQLFTLLDLLERIDVRSDVVKELDTQERNLVHWSQHPKIDNTVLTETLKTVVNIRDKLKAGKRPGSSLKQDTFLQSIRQRFAIPGGTCSFDLPHLHFWIHKPLAQREADIANWLSHVDLLYKAISMILTFLRQRSQFVALTAINGFYQGDSEDKSEIIRVRLAADSDSYPTLSGNKYRFALRFMSFLEEQSVAIDSDVKFEMASCR